MVSLNSLSLEDSRVNHLVLFGYDDSRIVRNPVSPAQEFVALISHGSQGYAFTLVVRACTGYTTHGVVVYRGADGDSLCTAWFVDSTTRTIVIARFVWRIVFRVVRTIIANVNGVTYSAIFEAE